MPKLPTSSHVRPGTRHMPAAGAVAGGWLAWPHGLAWPHLVQQCLDLVAAFQIADAMYCLAPRFNFTADMAGSDTGVASLAVSYLRARSWGLPGALVMMTAIGAARWGCWVGRHNFTWLTICLMHLLRVCGRWPECLMCTPLCCMPPLCF
jgi:hypothetical protein